MRPALLEYEPHLVPLTLSPDQAAEGRELEEAAQALEALDRGEGEAWLVRLIDDAARPRRMPPRRRLHLTTLLGLVARRTLRRRSGQRHSAVGRLYGLELEGLSAEDQLFELARRFVRLARQAAGHAALDTPRTAPAVAARRATHAAARSLAPGLVPFLAAHAAGGSRPTPGA